MHRNIFCWKGFGPVTGPPSFPGANFQQMVIARLSLGLSFLGLRNFLKLCHDEKPCTWWLGEKGLGSRQSRLARMLRHEYDALKGYRFFGGAISFYSVSCMSDVIFNPSLLNWSSLILTVARIDSEIISKILEQPHNTPQHPAFAKPLRQWPNTHLFQAGAGVQKSHSQPPEIDVWMKPCK